VSDELDDVYVADIPERASVTPPGRGGERREKVLKEAL
jgi:hypothetical protein